VASRKQSTIKPDDLTPREGKVLRFFVGRKASGDKQTATDDSIVEIPWSDLPHSHNQAMMAVRSLATKGLLTRVHEGQYTPTQAGITLVHAANKAKMWQVAPPPSLTNKPEHIDPVLQSYKPAAKPKPKAKPKAKPKPKPKAKPKAKGIIRMKKASK
jgi:outer membrane biosynthesis protein TonB